MKKKGSVGKYFVICLALCFCFSMLLLPTSADVGNSFTGGSSGGSSGGGFNGFFFFGSSPLGILAFIIVVAFVMYSKSRNSGGSVSPGSFSSNHFDEAQVVTRIQEVDPAFSAEHFKTYSSEVWLTVQEAWEKREWSVVRPFESNALFNVHNRQLNEYIEQQKTDHLDMQNIRKVAIADYRMDGEREAITVKLDASLLDYVTDDRSGKVLEGSKTQHQNRSYRLEFIRTTGIKTDTEKAMNTTNCPNCGAPTQVTSSGQCEYCKSVITTGEFGWVLNTFAKW